MTSINHPNIVQLLGVVIEKDRLGIVSQYVPRGSLFDLIHKQKDFVIEPKRRLRMVLDMCKGLHYLHSCKPPLVHRDLKSPK